MGCNTSKEAVVAAPPPDITDDIREKVRESWDEFIKVNDSIQREYGFCIFIKLFELSPEAKSLFDFLDNTPESDLTSNEKLAWHVKRVTDAISAMVSNLDHVEVVVKMLENLGARHAGYGAKEEYFASVGEGVIFALEQALKEKFTEGHKEAWRTMLTVVSYFMIKGMRKKLGEDTSTIL